MGQILHGSVRTTEAVRRAIQNSQESRIALVMRYCVNQKTGAKWKKRSSVCDERTDKKAALRFFKNAVGQHSLPEKITIDKIGANAAAIEALKEEAGQEIEMRQIKYLNNIVEQDHRAVKQVLRPTLGFKSFRSAGTTLQGIELVHMINKGQIVSYAGKNLSAAE